MCSSLSPPSGYVDAGSRSARPSHIIYHRYFDVLEEPVVHMTLFFLCLHHLCASNYVINTMGNFCSGFVLRMCSFFVFYQCIKSCINMNKCSSGVAKRSVMK